MARPVKRKDLAWPVLLAVAAVLLVINLLTQAYEDSIGRFPRAIVYYKDVVWYLDDMIAPSLYAASGILLLLAVPAKQRAARWSVLLLGAACMAIGIGDSFDVHWVFSRSMEASKEVSLLGNFGSKIMSVPVLGFAIIHAYEFMSRRMAKAVLFVFLLVVINQLMMATRLEYAGFLFHAVEEGMEAVAGCFLFWGVKWAPLRAG